MINNASKWRIFLLMEDRDNYAQKNTLTNSFWYKEGFKGY